MQQPTELERLKRERALDTEWLAKYKRIVDGLRQIAEIQLDDCAEGIDEWTAIYGGLNTLSKLLQEDINDRKEAAQ